MWELERTERHVLLSRPVIVIIALVLMVLISMRLDRTRMSKTFVPAPSNPVVLRGEFVQR